MAGLVSLPVETFREISGLLANPDKKALSGVCQSFRSLVGLEIFQTLTIDFHYTPRVRHQLQTLADSQATAHFLVGLCTRDVELRICNLEPLAEEEDGTKRTLEERAQRMEEIEEFRGNLGPALTALTRCECMRISTDPRGGNRIPPWLADILSVAIASMSTLKEIELSYQLGFPPPAIVAANTVPGLQRYEVSVAEYDGVKCTPEFTGALLSSIDVAISGKPELRELVVTTGLWYRNQGLAPTVGELFSGPCISSSPPLHLLSLELDGWSVEKAGFSVALPHLRHLRKLDLGWGISGSVDPIWDTLSEASIFLKSLQGRNVSTPALLRYLSSYQGLKEVSLRLAIPCNRPPGGALDPSRLGDVLGILSNHKTSLKRLRISRGKWGYSADDALPLRQFTALKRLTIPAILNLLPQLMDVALSLPHLVALCFISSVSWWSHGTAIQALRSMGFLMGAWVGEFVIPTTALESKLEDVSIMAGHVDKRFQRRGDRFRFGIVEPDGIWREIEEDEMLDQSGWVVKRCDSGPPEPIFRLCEDWYDQLEHWE